ncbi:MAG: BACON domain-containing protein, partial [Bacteroidales bacterium]|nr:BACON domain-containing protein [Bacteroidales bacterium]
MKIKNLFFGAVIALAAFACTMQEEIPAGIEVDVTKIEAGVDGKQIEVKVTSSEAWQALIPSAAQDWLHIVPAQGQKGVTSVKVSVDALGSGKGRSSRINFMAGLFTASIAVSQEGTVANGDGKTPQTAFSASEAYAWVMEHITTDNAPSDEPFYVKGFIHKIGTYKEVEQYFTGNSYGNATFYMSDAKEYDPNNEKDFEAYQVNYLGNRKFVQGQDTDIKIGDEVIIFGHLTKYKETAETMQQNTGKGAYIYSLNGVVEETEPQQEITSSTVADFIQKAEPNTYYRLTGKVSSFKTGTNNSGRNYMQFNITDDSGTILVYGFKSGQYEEWASKLSDGGTVVLNGTYEYYADKQQHEVVNATIESFEAGQGQTEITDITVAEFIQKADPSTYYKLTGKVTGFYTGESNGRKYMGFNLSDATGTVVVYGFKDGQYDQWADKLKDYGTVVLTGTYEYYASNQQHEVMNTTIISFEEGEAPTEFDDVTIAEFIQKADAANAYRLSGIVTDFNIDNAELKYMKITMKDDTGEILVYSFKEGEFDKWSGQITLGGAIVVVGTYKIYQGTPEVVEATIESF